MSLSRLRSIDMQKSSSSVFSNRTEVSLGNQTQLINLASDCSQLLYNSKFWDVCFVCCDKETVHANRAFLAVRSEFFRGLLYGGLHEALLDTITLRDATAAALQIVMHFLHSVEVKHADVSTMMDACELARKYNMTDCEESLHQQLCHEMLQDSSCISVVLERASSLAMPQLEVLALERCSSMPITPDTFLPFSPAALELCLSAAHLKGSEASILEAVIAWGRHQLSKQPGSTLQAVLADIIPRVQLNSIPANILRQLVKGTGLLLSHEVAALHCSQQAQLQPCLSRQYARRPWGEVGPDVCCTDIDMIEFKSQQHQGARSRHCLRAGTGSYVWHLSVDTYSSCTWIGLVQEDADMSRWLGNQEGCYMMGSNGSVACAAPLCDCCPGNGTCPLSPAEKVLYGNQSYHVSPYGAKYDADGSHVVVHIDMDARQCSFEVNGTRFGVAFYDLPDQVYPAVSMRYGGKLKFITCMGVN